MKFEDIPKEILDSELVGEMIVWGIIYTLVEVLPESESKDKMLTLIDNRVIGMTKMEL